MMPGVRVFAQCIIVKRRHIVMFFSFENPKVVIYPEVVCWIFPFFVICHNLIFLYFNCLKIARTVLANFIICISIKCIE